MTPQSSNYKIYQFNCPKCKFTSTAILKISDIDWTNLDQIMPVQKACSCLISLNHLEEHSTITVGQRLNPVDNKITV